MADKKSIDWYRNELRISDEKVKSQQAMMEEARKIVNGYLEEIAGLNSVIDQHYSNEELTSMLKECKDGRAKEAAQLEGGDDLKELRVVSKRGRDRIHSDICSAKWCAPECQEMIKLLTDDKGMLYADQA